MSPSSSPSQPPLQLAPMMVGELPPLDLVSVRATISRAQDRSSCPGPREVAELTLALRGHVERMLPHAQDRADQTVRGTVAWDRWQFLIDNARAAALDPPERQGLPGATLQMAALARQARFLADGLDA